MNYLLSNRTQVHPNYIIPDIIQIKYLLEECGYEYYLPKSLLFDLINIFTYHILEENMSLAIKKVNEEQLSFFNSLPLETIHIGTPAERAIYMLIELSKEYNLRTFEKKGTVREYEDNCNLIEELDDRDVIADEENSAEVINKILSLCNKLETKCNFKASSSEEKELKRMKQYKDLMSVRKSEMVRPDFGMKLANKSLNIEVGTDIIVDEVLIFVDDTSASMIKNGGYLVSKAIKRVLCNDVRDVHYYKLARSVKVEKWTSREEKIAGYQDSFTYLNSNSDFRGLRKELEQQNYNKAEIVMFTDGEDIPNTNTFPKGLTITVFSLNYNQKLANICKSTGGSFITL